MTHQSNFGDYNSGTYLPYRCDITNVVRGLTTIVTTSIDHAWVVGNEVIFLIPKVWGIRELNNLTGIVLDVPLSNKITVDIDSQHFSAFTVPTSTIWDYAQVLPAGDQNFGNLNPSGIPNQIIPGAFYNTYP